MRNTMICLALALLILTGVAGAQPTSIQQIQMNPASFGTVTIEGVVTVGVGKLQATRLQAYVQDESGYGIEIFRNTASSSDRTNFVRGNRVRVTGPVTNYSTTHAVTTEIDSPPTVVLLGTDSLPNAPLLTVPQTADSIHWEGAFFSVEGSITGSYNPGFAILWDLRDASTETISVKVPTTAALPADIIQLGRSYRIRGIGEQYDGHIEIDLLYTEDITSISDSDTTSHPDTTLPLISTDNLQVMTDSTTFIPTQGEQFKVHVAIRGNWRYLVKVFDMSGNPQRTLLDLTVTDSCGFLWDGKDQYGNLLPAGAYVIAIEVTNSTTGEVRRVRKPAVLAYILKKL